VLIYLGLSALSTFMLALLWLRLGVPSPLAVAHLVFAVGILPLISGAITHFVPVLTRSGSPQPGLQLAPLLLQLAGLLAVLAFIGEAPPGGLSVAAIAALLMAAFLAGWLVLRARRTLGRPHPGWRWYLAALLLLCLGLLCVPAMNWWPSARPALRLLHLHLNLLGFVGLSALGTLQVLLPTVLNTPDADAARRLQEDLPLAVGGVLMAAGGAAFSLPLALAGAALLLHVTLKSANRWRQRHGARLLMTDGAAAPLVGALCGLLVLLVLGVAHGAALLDGQDAIPAYVVAFLLPLVTGALTHLLPLWLRPGKRTPVRLRMQAALRRGGALRALLFVSGGSLLALGISDGLWAALLGMLSFLIALAGSLLALRSPGQAPPPVMK
jgi:hypothetical protein